MPKAANSFLWAPWPHSAAAVLSSVLALALGQALACSLTDLLWSSEMICTSS